MTYGDVLTLAIEKSKGKADVFVDYSPHVNKISIWVHINGREDNYDISNCITYYGYLDDRHKDETITPQACIDFINNTLSDDTQEEHY